MFQIFRERSEENRVTAIYKFLTILSEQLNEPEATKIISQQYPRYVTDSSLIQGQVSIAFFCLFYQRICCAFCFC
jgi:hypothetical protein